ncbi:MAG TPA: hypothetical protein DF409_05905 [Bacteroidales bacterium]|nr:hypothetical protein [Bacteroidales bacterium]
MIKERFSLRKLACASGISLGSLSDKLNNRSEFTASEIMRLSELLKAKPVEDYFFILKDRNIEQIGSV